MEMIKNFQPQMADNKIFEGEGGSYYSWSSSNFPLLSEAKVGAGKLSLQPRGFALPHYADCNKIAYVLQGSCTVGMVPPNSTAEEKVILIKKGDALPVPLGAVSWWFNGGDTESVMLFLGETSKAYASGEFTYFFLAGTLGVLGGFSTEFITRAYNITQKESEKLVNSQKGALIIKVEEGIEMPHPCNDTINSKMVTNIDNSLPDINVKGGGLLSTLTASKFPFLEQVGLGAKLVNLEANAMEAPTYAADGSSVQVIYVVSGGGRIQLVGANGQNVLDTKVQAGHLFVVPAYFAAAKIACGQGMKCFSVITSPKPVIGELAGNTSVWKALSPAVLQASLAVTPEFVELFESKIRKSTIIIPPQN